MSVAKNGKTMESIVETIREEIGEQLSDCCGAKPAGGLVEIGLCSHCHEHTEFYWEADEDEVEAIFKTRTRGI